MLLVGLFAVHAPSSLHKFFLPNVSRFGKVGLPAAVVLYLIVIVYRAGFYAWMLPSDQNKQKGAHCSPESSTSHTGHWGVDGWGHGASGSGSTMTGQAGYQSAVDRFAPGPQEPGRIEQDFIYTRSVGGGKMPLFITTTMCQYRSVDRPSLLSHLTS